MPGQAPADGHTSPAGEGGTERPMWPQGCMAPAGPLTSADREGLAGGWAPSPKAPRLGSDDIQGWPSRRHEGEHPAGPSLPPPRVGPIGLCHLPPDPCPSPSPPRAWSGPGPWPDSGGFSWVRRRPATQGTVRAAERCGQGPRSQKSPEHGVWVLILQMESRCRALPHATGPRQHSQEALASATSLPGSWCLPPDCSPSVGQGDPCQAHI